MALTKPYDTEAQAWKPNTSFFFASSILLVKSHTSTRTGFEPRSPMVQAADAGEILVPYFLEIGSFFFLNG